MSISFGLTPENLEFRRGSLGASDARTIVNGTDEEIARLWQIKRGELPAENLDDEIYCQFGQFVESFHRHWFENRTGVALSQVGEEVFHPDYPGMHVTLDGYVDELEPVVFADGRGDFKFSWGCKRPAGRVSAVWEAKWRNARQFNLEQQVATFAPQCHQGMAMTESEFAILSTFTSDLVIYARVMPFDSFYWAQCMMRIEDFREAVASGRQPTKFPRLSAPDGALAEVRTIQRTVDMSKTSKANEWAAFAAMLMSSAPTEGEKSKASNHEKAKAALKAMLDKDVGIAKGFGVTAKRNKAGAISFEIDEKELEAVRSIIAIGKASAA
jgi:hypothetical protein